MFSYSIFPHCLFNKTYGTNYGMAMWKAHVDFHVQKFAWNIFMTIIIIFITSPRYLISLEKLFKFCQLYYSMISERVCCYHIKNNSIFSLLSVGKINFLLSVGKWIASADTKKKFCITHAHTYIWVYMYIVDPHYHI